MMNPKAPPFEKNKMKNPKAHLPLLKPQESSLFSSLPDEIVLIILARIPRSYYRSICLVSKRFYSLLSSPDIYTVRSSIGATEPRIYVCLWLVHKYEWYTLTVIKGLLCLGPIRPEKSVSSISLSSDHPPTRFDSTTVVAGSEIYKIGGVINGERSRFVFALDCRTHMWRRAPDMRVSRAGAKSCFLDGKIYVIGGYKKTEEVTMNWGEVFDLNTQTWKLLPSPSDEAIDSNHEIAVFGTRLYIITKHNHYAYDQKETRWLTKVGFMDIEPITGTQCGSIEKVMENITVCEKEDPTSTHYQWVSGSKPIDLNTGPWCLIGNVMFSHYKTKYNWYCSRRGKWINIEGLNDLYEERCYNYSTIELVNYGGKLLIIWYEWLQNFFENGEKKIWCGVIRLEERTSPSLGFHIWGELEHCNIILPLTNMFHHLSTCKSVLL